MKENQTSSAGASICQQTNIVKYKSFCVRVAFTRWSERKAKDDKALVTLQFEICKITATQNHLKGKLNKERHKVLLLRRISILYDLNVQF